jgi:hypothetical protein
VPIGLLVTAKVVVAVTFAEEFFAVRKKQMFLWCKKDTTIVPIDRLREL